MARPTYVEIDLEAIAHNVHATRKRIGKNVRLLVAVKADGYGHGAVPVAKTAVEHGADWLGIATVEEGIELRRAEIKTPILIFGALTTDEAGQIMKRRITPALTSLDFALALNRAAKKSKKRTKVHVNIDTGMGRVGFTMDEALEAILEIEKMPNLMIEGLMTHFPSADEEDKTFTLEQLERFGELIGEIRKRQIHLPILHTANSGAILDVPQADFNMVRLGISLYGYYPSGETSESIDLKPAMSVRSRIVHLKTVEQGASISYGRTFIAERETRVATVPMGYADGLGRELSNRGKMIVRDISGNGTVCPIIGRVCMDQTMIDVTDAPDAAVGSEVTVISADRADANSVESTARLLRTIPHAVTCAISTRVPRIYLPAHPPAS